MNSNRFTNLNSSPEPLDSGAIDIPVDFDPRYDLQEKCDCGNDKWESGLLKLGRSTITNEDFNMKANLCTSCKSPQLWISREYLKNKK